MAAIGRGRLRTSAMARGGGARVSVKRGFRGTESERVRGEAAGGGRGGRERPYPCPSWLGKVGTTRGRRERPRGSLQREVGDDREAFAPRSLPFIFPFLSGPFFFLNSVFYLATTVIYLIEVPKHFRKL